jgi:hypothetical protein
MGFAAIGDALTSATQSVRPHAAIFVRNDQVVDKP